MAYSSSQVDNLIALRLLKILVTPFKEFPAYKSGVIDEKGKYIVPKDKRTKDQQKTLTYLDRLLINIKKLINKLPGGENKLKNLIAAMALIKECQQNDDDGELLTEQMIEQFVDQFNDNDANSRQLIQMWTTYLKLKEQMGTSAISGSAQGDYHEPAANNTSGVQFYSLPISQHIVRRKEL